MPNYQAPLRDMHFVLYELHGGHDLAKLPGFEEMTEDLINPTLEAAAQLHENARPVSLREPGVATEHVEPNPRSRRGALQEVVRAGREDQRGMPEHARVRGGG